MDYANGLPPPCINTVDTSRSRLYVSSRVVQGSPRRQEVSMFGRRSSRHDPFHVPLNRAAPSARQAMLLAHAEASWLHHSYMGTEHLLIRAAREPTGAAALGAGRVGAHE